MRHRWSDPVRYNFRTVRVCMNGCGVVKSTRHDAWPPWQEFYRDHGGEAEAVRIDGTRTPVCEEVS